MTTEMTFAGFEITISDDEWAVMPEGGEDEREKSLSRYAGIAERELTAAFPGAEITHLWSDAFAVKVDRNGDAVNPEDETEIENDVRDILQRVFENGGW